MNRNKKNAHSSSTRIRNRCPHLVVILCIVLFTGSSSISLGYGPQKSLELLLPAPQKIETVSDETKCVLQTPIRLAITGQWAENIEAYLWLLNAVLTERHTGPVVSVKDGTTASIRVDKAENGLPENGYELTVMADGVTLAAKDTGGVFNGLATLAQMIELSETEEIALPATRIRDWPELPIRAIHIDMTCQQYKAAYVQELMRTFARYKVNAILMEYSDMFPFREHKAISREDAFTSDELQAIIKTARECHQEIIPFLQSCGHLEYVLRRAPYAQLATGHDGYNYCLTNDQVLPFAESLIDEMIAQHPGLRRLHIGGDEINAGNCARCRQAGDFFELYLKHYARLAEYCQQRGITPLIWADVLAGVHLQNKFKDPAQLAQAMADYRQRTLEILPKNVMLVDWRYRGPDAFMETNRLQAMGYSLLTASAARSYGDSFVLPRVKFHMENIRAGALKAIELKQPGTIITSWSYRGSPHEVCLPQYAAAAYGWNSRTPEIPELLTVFLRQRYGLNREIASAASEAMLTETNQIVQTTVSRPRLDNNQRAWIVSAADQAEQFTACLEKDDNSCINSLKNTRQTFENNRVLWQKVQTSAVYHQNELKSWDLSRRILTHRLLWLEALATVAKDNSAAGEGSISDIFDRSRTQLRMEWEKYFAGIFSPNYMKVELYHRFDAEPEIIQTVQKQVLSRSKTTASKELPRLIAHWPLAGNIEDATGNHSQKHAGEFFYTTGPDGKSNGAVLFDGKENFIEVPDGKSLHFGKDDFSISVWVKPEAPMTNAFGDILSKFDSKVRQGINFHIAGSSPGYNAMSETRHVHFGIDDGYLGPWKNCGKPWESNAGVTSLIVFQDNLYAGIADAARPQDAARVFRWIGGQQWQDCGRLGTDPKHLSVMSMIVHDGRLYAGTGIWDWVKCFAGQAAPTRVFVYEGGTAWRDLGQVGNGSRVMCLGSYEGKLYAGLDRVGGGKCFQYDGRSWLDCGAPDGRNFECLMPLGGRLYGATHGNIYRYEGGQKWTCIGEEPFGENQIHSLEVAAAKLHAGCWPHGYVLRCEGDKNWVISGQLGEKLALNVDIKKMKNEVNDLLVHNGKLYAGAIPFGEVYRYETDGQWTLLKSLVSETAQKSSWSRVTAMASYQGKLWAGTSSCNARAIDVDPEGTLGCVYAVQTGQIVSHQRDIGGGWTHVAAIRQGRQLRLYINGNLSAASDAPEGRRFDITNTEPLRIGFGAQNYFTGAMADLRLYGGAIDIDQIKELATH